MAIPRRRLVRPTPVASNPDRQRQIHKLRTRLELDRAALARWMSRLKQAFHAVEKHQLRMGRLERQITTLEEP